MVQSSAPDRTELKRREILLAAARVFRTKGFHGAGMRDIAAELGIAVGKLYYYFASKQDLLAYCQESCLRELLAMTQRVTEGVADTAARLYLVIVGHVHCLHQTAPGALAHLEVESLEPALRARVVDLRDRYERGLRDLVRAGTRSGAFRRADPKVAALTILGAVNWTVKWYDPEGSKPLGTIAAGFAEHLVRGLLSEGGTLRVPSFHDVPDLFTQSE